MGSGEKREVVTHACCICFGEEAGARNLAFFRVKWLQRAMKGTSSVRRVRLGSFLSRIVPPMCFATSGCSCVRSSMVFCNSVPADRNVMAASRLLRAAACVILLSFELNSCNSYWNGCIPAAIVICQQIFLNYGASNFPFKNPFKKMLQNRLFFALA